MRVRVELTHRVDVGEWGRRHARAEVPDAAPYGLDRLERRDIQLSFRPTVSRRPMGGMVRGAVRRAACGFEVAEAASGPVRRHADVVLCWDERTGVPAAMRSHLPGEPSTATGVIWMTEPGAGRGIRGRLAINALRGCQSVWALSTAQVGVLRHSWRLRDSMVHWLPFGVDVDFWSLAPVEDVPSADRVLTVGNDRHRDHGLVVEAVRRSRLAGRKTRLDLVTHHVVPRRDVPVNVHRSTSHAELRRRYGESSVVAVALRPNLHVSGITVALEAMACARPVVISNTPGMDDYVEDGVSGLLVPPGDADAMSAALIMLSREPAMAKEIGLEGRRRVRSLFSSAVMTEHLADILRGAHG